MVILVGLAAPGRPAFAQPDDATSQARSHYEMGLKLFDAREHEQALIEFKAANELKPRPAALFMMAQCEYLLGKLKDARAHYARYASENPDGEFVELAQDRIQSSGDGRVVDAGGGRAVDDDRRRAVVAEGGRFRLDIAVVRTAVYARVELGEVRYACQLADGLEAILGERAGAFRVLVGIKPVVIRPEHALVFGAAGRVGGVE